MALPTPGGPRVLSLFSGYGGLDLAVETVWPGARVVCHVERDGYSASVLVARMEESRLVPAPVWSDVSTFDGRPWRGAVDLVTAGFPCQPFSSAGSRKGVEDERWLWPSIERILRTVRPRRVFLENVPGLVRHGLGPVLRGLAVLGYDAEWNLFSAEAVDAPHRRTRFFLLAELADGDGDGRGGGEERDLGETGRLHAPRRDDAHRRGGSRDRRLDLFPPPPDRLDLWAGLLAETPEIEPSLCRFSDGASALLDDRSDRLRTLGNGVVPLQAAIALRVLESRLADP